MRKYDSGWRDVKLVEWHQRYGLDFPVAGMTSLYIEYDHGRPVGLINYIRRGEDLPLPGNGVSQAFRAAADLYGVIGHQLPFLTVKYDPRNWAVLVFPHNQAAHELPGLADPGWHESTELGFITLLYQLRGRSVPDDVATNTGFNDTGWITGGTLLPATGWQGQELSKRRREHEPHRYAAPRNHLNPCVDIDFCVVGKVPFTMNLVVDYKRDGARVNLKSTNHQAMAALYDRDGYNVPAMVVRYQLGVTPLFGMNCLNEAAVRLLKSVIGGRITEWTTLDEGQWLGVISEAYQV